MNLSPLMQLLRCRLRRDRRAPTGGAVGRRPELAVFPPMPAPIETQQAPRPPTWQAMPGLVLELGASGFQIHMNLGPPSPRLPSRYTLVNPEGWNEAWGVDLQGLKQHAERLVRDRAEFVCDRKGWAP